MFSSKCSAASLLLTAFTVLATGCATAPAGHANFTIASTKTYGAKDGATVITHVDRKTCMHNLLLVFAWGDSPDHEYLLKSILEETGGDAITNASLNFTSIPLILYNQSCVQVEGDVVRFAKEAPAAPKPADAPQNGPEKEES
jgi:hypothetical protein